MIKIENVVTPSPEQWEAIIMGIRNPMNSWDRSDTMIYEHELEDWPHERVKTFNGLGSNDYDLMMRLAKGGPVHAKYRRMITVYVTITAPLYWWKEFDTYKVGTVANSCSTMHKIADKEFTIEDFSHEHLLDGTLTFNIIPTAIFRGLIDCLNENRRLYLQTKDKKYWWQMIQLLPSSYNQKRTVMLNYEVLANIYKSRKDHKLDEWAETKLIGDHPSNMYPNKFTNGFCDWIKTLPYSELITGEWS